jgi:hypothetical protein
MCILLVSSITKWKDNDYELVKICIEMVMASLEVPSQQCPNGLNKIAQAKI